MQHGRLSCAGAGCSGRERDLFSRLTGCMCPEPRVKPYNFDASASALMANRVALRALKNAAPTARLQETLSACTRTACKASGGFLLLCMLLYHLPVP